MGAEKGGGDKNQKQNEYLNRRLYVVLGGDKTSNAQGRKGRGLGNRLEGRSCFERKRGKKGNFELFPSLNIKGQV